MKIPSPGSITGRFSSRLHDERVAATLGIWLGICFGICFGTGLVSHAIQHPPGWFTWPSRPVNLYRVTQGLHVLTGIAAIPLLLAKLWTVYPKLYEWPPVRSAGHAVERLSVAVLVGGAGFQLFTGLANVAYWYPFGFFFPITHYWTAWITIGALVIHIGTKAALARRALRTAPDPALPAQAGGLTRRGFLTAVGAASGIAVVANAGSAVPGVPPLLGTRDPEVGPQGLPVNKSAAGAGVTTSARNPGYQLQVQGERSLALSLAELRALPQYTVSLPISCVEGWSAPATWTGVRVRDLLDRAGVPPDATVRVESLQQGGLYRASLLGPPHSSDPLTLLALDLHGEELHLDHGYPCRLIAPNRPGVLQTKWVASIRMLP